VAGLFFGLTMPPTLSSAVAWILSTLGAVLIGAAITNLLNITMLWTISGEGISSLISAFTWLFSGITLPLLFFPDWTQTAINAMPFRYLMDVPFRFYMGQIPPEEFWKHFLIQMVWVLILVGLGHALLKLGVRKLVVQGG